ncbi:MAG: PqqD family protein [Alphaproteobacteria bacterium]
MIGDAQYLHINGAKIAHDVIDGEVILVNVENGFYYSLRGSAASIWSGIEAGHSLAELRLWLAKIYGEATPDIPLSVDSFVRDLVADEILLASDAPPPPAAPKSLPEAPGTTFVVPVIERFTEMQDLLTLDPIHEVDDLGWPHRATPPE